MKALFWVGLVVLILGVASLIVPIPQRNRDAIKIGDLSLGVETQSEDKIAPALSAVMILGGLGAIAAGKLKSS
jgi:hypothetical protein